MKHDVFSSDVGSIEEPSEIQQGVLEMAEVIFMYPGEQAYS